MHLSDHFLITFKASLDFQKDDRKTISFRDIKSLDTEKFCNEAKLGLNSVQHDAFGEKIDFYNNTLRSLINKYAPVKKKVMKVSPNSPWFDHDYLNLRKKRRAAEKKYHKTKSENDKKNFHRFKKRNNKTCFH